MIKSVHFTVSGRVQGVFFSMPAKLQADQRQVNGWVCNLADGCVEGVATAKPTSLNSFIDWLNSGPELALVLKVEVNDIETEEYEGFETR